MKNYLVLLSFISIFVNGCQSNLPNESNEYSERIDSIFVDYDDINKPGAAVAVVQDGAIVFKKGYGSANLEYDIPVTSSTIFHIASVSKQFTVFSILLLAEEGKLNLDDDIRKFIPEVPDFGKKITLRHLASHTSGLRDQWNLLVMAGWRFDDVITKEHVMKLVANQKELNFDPGEESEYCNTGFTLLAEVVTRISGMSFAEFTNSKIFNPLQMTSTLFYDDHEKIVSNRAYSYYSDDEGFKKSVLSYANVGATSLFTTVEDLSLWSMNFASLKVGNKEVIDQMNALATLNNGKTFGGAYGQFVNKYKGLNQIQHGGADAGYRSYLGRFPDENFAVMVFSNFAASNAGGLALKVADVFLEEKFIIEPGAEGSESNYIHIKNDELEAFIGAYWNNASSYSRTIKLRNDTLRYWRGEGNESALLPINSSTFKMLDVPSDITVSFEILNNKKLMKVTLDEGEPIISEEYIPTNYTLKDLQEFTGEFYSDELRTAYSIVLNDSTLVFKHSRISDFNIIPIKKDMFAGDEWFFDNIVFERNNANSITGMRVSNGRVRNLYFEKQLTTRYKAH